MSMHVHHGGAQLPAVVVDAYNAELRDEEGFLGDRASNRAFRSILDQLRDLFPDAEDPLGKTPSKDISKRSLDRMLAEGDPEAGGVILGAIETWSQEFAGVIRRFLRLEGWQGTQRIVVGGGLRGSRVGELAVGRTTSLLRGENCGVELVPIRHHPDEAGLIGGAHLAPSWMFSGHDSILAVDIGGTNIRAGIVTLNLKKGPDLSRAAVLESELWRHRDDKPERDQAVDRLASMLRGLIGKAGKEGHKLAPFIGVGCPGLIRDDGSIERGGQNLPGNWEEGGFKLADRLRDAIPRIDGHEVAVVMHNDAVVQGLSEAPFMKDVQHWGVMTIGTGLGNARFTNREGDGNDVER